MNFLTKYDEVMHMKNIKDIYHEFVEETRLPVDWDEQLSDALKSYKPEELQRAEGRKETSGSAVYFFT